VTLRTRPRHDKGIDSRPLFFSTPDPFFSYQALKLNCHKDLWLILMAFRNVPFIPAFPHADAELPQHLVPTWSQLPPT